jgi:regulatory protein
LVISAIEQVSPGCMKIAAVDGPAFFIRTVYLQHVDSDVIIPGAEFTEEAEEDILNAGLCYAAEIKAVDYLSRAEQSRFGLTRKLSAKGMQIEYINRALDYLESKNYLSDARYTCAWLNSRKATHHEGLIRLAAELCSRGIDRHTADNALAVFFEENPEVEECRKAAEKCIRLGMDYDKAVRFLVQHGFTAKMIAAESLLFKKSDKKVDKTFETDYNKYV